MQIYVYKQARALRKRKNNTAKCDTMNKYIFKCTATGTFIQIENMSIKNILMKNI